MNTTLMSNKINKKRKNRIACFINKVLYLTLFLLIYLNNKQYESGNSKINGFQIYQAFLIFRFVNALPCTLTNYNVGFYSASSLIYNNF